MRAIILSIGDELVLGQTVDTNSAWISRQLAGVGCAVAAHVTVADDQRAIEQAIEEAVGRCDFLIISGGIGPTEDDLTRQALAAMMRVPLELNETWLKVLRRFFEQRGRPMPEANRIQAMIPAGATMISNSNGTAAGIDATYVSGDQKTVCRVFVMPGVPKEMQAMFTRDVLPHVKKASGGAVILSRTLHTFGLGESAVAEKLGDLMRRDRNPSVGTTVSGGVVSLRLNARFQGEKMAVTELGRTYARCEEALGDLIYGEDDETLATAISKLWWANQSETHAPCPFTVATAESCTGGLLAKMLTDVRFSSRYFKQGWVTYSNESKTSLLGVDPAVVERDGAVSEAVVKAMATGAARGAQAKYALAISGIAGPDGGTPAKPVGTVWIALAENGGDQPSVQARLFNFPGDREMVRDRSAKMALTMLRYRLLGKDLPF
jgi:nicotinamide-nucleotide amidase